jgi:hypothetical protein
MPHYVVTARLELDADSDLEAHLRVEAALEGLGDPGLVAVDEVDEVDEFHQPATRQSPAAEAADAGPDADAAVAGNLARLARLGVDDLARVRPGDRVALLGVVEVAGQDRPHVWVDTAWPTRRPAQDDSQQSSAVPQPASCG